MILLRKYIVHIIVLLTTAICVLSCLAAVGVYLSPSSMVIIKGGAIAIRWNTEVRYYGLSSTHPVMFKKSMSSELLFFAARLRGRPGLLSFPLWVPGVLLSSIIVALRLYRRDKAALRCKKCNYSLVGLRSQLCPECGTQHEPEETKAGGRDLEAT